MRRLYTITALMCGLLCVGCTSLFTASTFAPDDLYRTDNREVVLTSIAAQAEAEARQAEWNAQHSSPEFSYGSEPSYSSVVADSYESAYARRLYGFNSPTYKLPSSYYNLAGNRSMYYATAYDPAHYNIMVSGDQVWVEPKYITSMFGSWGATNITFGIYSSPWNYGWGYHTNPFYYSWWGYPHYSWYDWNWNICYNPWYYDYCWGYPSYGHHHHHYYPGYMPPRPPQHRPSDHPGNLSGNRPNHGFVVTGPGASVGSSGNLNGGRGSSSSRYTSPISNKNYGSSTITSGSGRGGTISTGVNTGGSYQPSGATVGGAVRPSANGGTNRGTVSGSGSTSGGGSNFRQGGSSGRGTTTSSYRGGSGSSSTSSYRSGSGSGSSTSSGRGGSSSGGGGTTSSRR